MKIRLIKFSIPTSLVAILLVAGLALATTTVKMNLAQLSGNAGRIFTGKCIAINEGTVPGPGGGQIPFTSYTFRVTRSIKGDVGRTIEVRQLGYRAPKLAQGRAFIVPGMPAYAIGEEFVLLLTQESSLGLTAPVGMGQGSFKVYIDGNGARRVANAVMNAGLFDKMESGDFAGYRSFSDSEVKLLSRRKGGLRYDDFLSILDKMAR